MTTTRPLGAQALRLNDPAKQVGASADPTTNVETGVQTPNCDDSAWEGRGPSRRVLSETEPAHPPEVRFSVENLCVGLDTLRRADVLLAGRDLTVKDPAGDGVIVISVSQPPPSGLVALANELFPEGTATMDVASGTLTIEMKADRAKRQVGPKFGDIG